MADRIEIVERPIEPAGILAGLPGPADGAVALFLGTVRDHHEGRTVLRLEYHAYREMALHVMHRIASEVGSRFSASAVALVHRVGILAVGEISVAVAVATAHRAEAFAACRHAMERLKTEVPIWKKEHFEGGESWVAGSRPER